MRVATSAILLVAFAMLQVLPSSNSHGLSAAPAAGGATDFTFTSHRCDDIQLELRLKISDCSFVVEGDMQPPEDGPYYWAGLRNEEFSCASLRVFVKVSGGGGRLFLLPPGTDMGAEKIFASQLEHHLEIEIRANRMSKRTNPACAVGNELQWAMSMSISTHLFEPITFDARVEGRYPDKASPGDTIKYAGAGWKIGNGPVKVFLGRKLLKSFPPRSFSGSVKWTGVPRADTCATVLKAEQGTGDNKIRRMIALGPGPVIEVAWAHEVKIAGPRPRLVGPDSNICEFETDFITTGPNGQLLMKPFKDFKPGELGDLPRAVYSTAFKISAYHRARRVAVGNIVAPTVVFHSSGKVTHTMFGDQFSAWADVDPCVETLPACPPSVEVLAPPGQVFDEKLTLERRNRAAVDVEFRKGVVLKGATLWGGFSIYVTGDGPDGGLRGNGVVFAGSNLSVAGPLELVTDERVTLGVFGGVLTIKGCGTC